MTVEEIKNEKERLCKRLNDLEEQMASAIKEKFKDSGISTQLEILGFKAEDENTWTKNLNSRFDLTVQWDEDDGSCYLTLIDSYADINCDILCSSETLMEEIKKFKVNVYKQILTFSIDAYAIGELAHGGYSRSDMVNAVLYARECGDINEANVKFELVNTLGVN